MLRKKRIIPAIIGKSQDELDDRLSRVLDYVDLVQLDIMDNEFVPNTSLFFDFKLPETFVRFEAHLMVVDPIRWIEQHWSKVNMILVHCESVANPSRVIELIRSKGKQVGFVLNPETSVDKIRVFIDDIDQVLVMTVKPGFYGSEFIPDMVDKIERLRQLRGDLDIEVDGGITPETIGMVNKAGANMFVSGSFIVKSSNVPGAIKQLRDIVTM